MTFSEFAKVMYRFCNEKPSKSDFVVHLVNKIMAGQPGRANGEDSYQNPLAGKSQDVLLKYFTGDRSIPGKDASMIYSHIKREKFENYIEKRCSPDAQYLLLEDLLKIGGENLLEKEGIEKNSTPPQICAQLFTNILGELAEA